MQTDHENWAGTIRERLLSLRGPVVVHWLLLINILVFLLGFAMQVETSRGYLDVVQLYGAYRAYMCFQEGEVWRLVSYQFLHANLGHIAFNMIALWFFGPPVEERFGHLRFLLYYLACGVAAALFSSLLGYMGFFDPIWPFIPMVGASGSIYGIMAACAVLFPHARVQLLIPPVNLSVRQFALVVLGIACAVIIFQWNNAGGEAGHLGGMFAGFVLTLLILLKEKLTGSRSHSVPAGHRQAQRRPIPPRREKFPSSDEVNAIMEKISRSGLSSLTEKEREVLQRASRK